MTLISAAKGTSYLCNNQFSQMVVREVGALRQLFRLRSKSCFHNGPNPAMT